MKITCSTKDLNEALQHLLRAVPSNPQTPVLAGIHIKAEGSMLELQSTNLSLGIIVKIGVNTEIPGEIVISGKYLQEIARKLPSDMVTMTNEGETGVVKITSGNASFNLLSMNAEDFPKVKPPETYATFRVKSGIIKDAIRRTAYACSNDDTRPIFTGCYFEINGSSFNLVATNTHRLALVKQHIADDVGELRFIVPGQILRDLYKMIDSTDPGSIVTVDCGMKFAAFTFDNVYLTTRLIDGQFPPYEKVIPRESTTFAVVNVAEMLETVDRVSLISKETEYNTIRFYFSAQDGLHISSNSPEVGRSDEWVNAKIEGEDVDISFNVLYIADVLKALDSEECRIALTKSLAPADIREVGNDNFIYVVTPVRTN